jgi:hypothetical protein
MAHLTLCSCLRYFSICLTSRFSVSLRSLLHVYIKCAGISAAALCRLSFACMEALFLVLSLVFRRRFVVLISMSDGASGLIDLRVEIFSLLSGDLVELMSLTEPDLADS